jgi:hypothetical protein
MKFFEPAFQGVYLVVMEVACLKLEAVTSRGTLSLSSWPDIVKESKSRKLI